MSQQPLNCRDAIGHLWREVLRCRGRQSDPTAPERLHMQPAGDGGTIVSLDPGDGEEYGVTYWKFLFNSCLEGIEKALAACHSPKSPHYQDTTALMKELHPMVPPDAGRRRRQHCRLSRHPAILLRSSFERSILTSGLLLTCRMASRTGEDNGPPAHA